MSHAEDEVISTGWHWTYGWLRRPELDVAYDGYAYEDGDGDIMIFKDRRYKRGVYLECRLDLHSMERYVCVSSIPRVCNFRQKRKESRKLKKS
jgi:hydroxyacyl-ACP dehydratase HTD2-like protein with hotdog domain